MDTDTTSLISRINATLATARLSAWQRNFLTDMQSRLARYGSNTRLSEKQRRKLEEIVGSGSPVNVVAFVPKETVKQPIRWQRRKRSFLVREGRWWARRFLRDFAFAAALVVGFLIYSAFEKVPLSLPFNSGERTSAETIDHQTFSVTDGDTIRINGEVSGTRLVGFNTPEKFSPKCDRKRDLGNRASARLAEIVSKSSMQLTKVRCSCSPGTEGTDRCNYGRSCGVLRADGRDVGEILISEGLAVPFNCGATGCPPTPRPWCN
ncbi:thermonuclease family protein [Rhizobium sp. BK399]|uniref:thermonuclease family protein n=1 Tax=Rhizobium sp. BK399 TaxID=2587063 RepID=UPI001847BFC5|nr:endonuclease YncB(thermonuclease family) [Rhizobium sp. BK399]